MRTKTIIHINKELDRLNKKYKKAKNEEELIALSFMCHGLEIAKKVLKGQIKNV